MASWQSISFFYQGLIGRLRSVEGIEKIRLSIGGLTNVSVVNSSEHFVNFYEHFVENGKFSVTS